LDLVGNVVFLFTFEICSSHLNQINNTTHIIKM
jgi:hypothetical protein